MVAPSNFEFLFARYTTEVQNITREAVVHAVRADAAKLRGRESAAILRVARGP